MKIAATQIIFWPFRDFFFFFGQSPSKSISKNHHHWPQLKLNRISPVFSSLATKCVALFLRLCSLLCGDWNSAWLIIKIRHASHNTDFTVMCRCTYLRELYEIVQCVSASIKNTFDCYSFDDKLLLENSMANPTSRHCVRFVTIYSVGASGNKRSSVSSRSFLT